jgi:hypothetical protein
MAGDSISTAGTSTADMPGHQSNGVNAGAVEF